MKSMLILAIAALLAVNAVAWAMPGAGAKVTGASAQPVVMMAEQELPFDRYWSKN
jgi:hypothetical protein